MKHLVLVAGFEQTETPSLRSTPRASRPKYYLELYQKARREYPASSPTAAVLPNLLSVSIPKMALQVFNASFGDDDERRAKLTALVADGEPWFRATEAAAALGYKNPQLAIRTHVDEDDKRALRDL